LPALSSLPHFGAHSDGVAGTADVKEVARRPQLLLNGNNVAMLVPGGRPSA